MLAPLWPHSRPEMWPGRGKPGSVSKPLRERGKMPQER
jgi:hypothetical protein